LPGVLLAAYIVKEIPLSALRWMVACVIVYAAVALLRSARAGDDDPPPIRIEP
jgi:uncharacterized membrane protein YfcA